MSTLLHRRFRLDKLQDLIREVDGNSPRAPRSLQRLLDLESQIPSLILILIEVFEIFILGSVGLLGRILLLPAALLLALVSLPLILFGYKFSFLAIFSAVENTFNLFSGIAVWAAFFYLFYNLPLKDIGAVNLLGYKWIILSLLAIYFCWSASNSNVHSWFYWFAFPAPEFYFTSKRRGLVLGIITQARRLIYFGFLVAFIYLAHIYLTSFYTENLTAPFRVELLPFIFIYGDSLMLLIIMLWKRALSLTEANVWFPLSNEYMRSITYLYYLFRLKLNFALKIFEYRRHNRSRAGWLPWRAVCKKCTRWYHLHHYRSQNRTVRIWDCPKCHDDQYCAQNIRSIRIAFGEDAGSASSQRPHNKKFYKKNRLRINCSSISEMENKKNWEFDFNHLIVLSASKDMVNMFLVWCEEVDNGREKLGKSSFSLHPAYSDSNPASEAIRRMLKGVCGRETKYDED